MSLWYVLRGEQHHVPHYDHNEFHQIAWFPIDGVPSERTDPHLSRFCAKLRHYLTQHIGMSEAT